MKKSRSTSAAANKRSIDATAVRAKAAVEIQANAAQTLAAAMPYNSAKRKEFGRDNAVSPPAGQSVVAYQVPVAPRQHSQLSD